MSFGNRLKRIRNHRNMTMKEVGMRLRIPERQADVRMSQYESNKKMPRKDIIKYMAGIFDVNEEALDIPDIETHHGAIFELFEYYFLYGLHPVRIDGKVYLGTDKNITSDDLIERLNDWCDEYENLEKGIITKNQFIEWMINYPKYSKHTLPRKRDEWLKKY